MLDLSTTLLIIWSAVMLLILGWFCIQQMLFTPSIKNENNYENCQSNIKIIIDPQHGNSKSVINTEKCYRNYVENYYVDNINKYFYLEKQIETLNKEVGKLEDDHHENISKIIMELKPQNYCQRKMRILGNENKYYQQHKLHGEIIKLENEKRNYQNRQHHQKEELEQLQKKIALQEKQIIRLENENENDQKRQHHQKEELEQLQQRQIIRLENENENYQELEQLQQKQIIRLENENENYQNRQHHQKEELEQLQKKIALLNKHPKCFQAKKKDVVTTQALEKILQQNQLLPQTFEEKK